MPSQSFCSLATLASSVTYCTVLVTVAVLSGGRGMIEMSSAALTSSPGPLNVQLFSRAVSSRLSADPLCLYFRYYIHSGIDGHFSVYTLDNADVTTLQWTLSGHLMHAHLRHSWQFGFVQINTAGGPFQVCTAIFTARRYASAVLAVIVCLSVCPSVRLSHKSELYKYG